MLPSLGQDISLEETNVLQQVVDVERPSNGAFSLDPLSFNVDSPLDVDIRKSARPAVGRFKISALDARNGFASDGGMCTVRSLAGSTRPLLSLPLPPCRRLIPLRATKRKRGATSTTPLHLPIFRATGRSSTSSRCSMVSSPSSLPLLY